MDDQVILSETEGPILSLVLNRPKALNAFNLELAQALGEALGRAADDENIRAVVLRGAGKAFSAGGDIKLFHQEMKKGGQNFRQVFRHLNVAIHHIRTMPKPVVAAIQGPAYAAGFGVALSCDLIVASHGSTLSPSFVNIALAPNASTTYFLPRVLGFHRATEALMRGKIFTASEALELGLANHVWAEESFEAELMTLLKDLAARPTGALSRIKHLMNSSFGNTWQDQLELEKEEIALASLSFDFREGVTAFVEKRRPKFKGK